MIITRIQDFIVDACKSLELPQVDIKVTYSNRPDLCDYQCDNAFQLANILHTSPMEVATTICDAILAMPNCEDYFASVEPCKPGFVNIKVSNKFLNEELNRQMQSPNFNLSLANPNELYFLDYGGPNIAKPLHVGHLRSAIVGESIKRIINFAGGKTMCDVHFGDYGLQMGQVIYGMKKYDITPQQATLSDLERLYPEISGLCKEDEDIKQECAIITKELQDGGHRDYFEKILALSIADIKRIYKYLGVSFDLYEGESDAYKYLPNLFDKFLKEKKIVESQGAYVIPIGEELPPVVFRKSNGAYLYASTDVGSIYEREKKYNPQCFIYVADLRQDLHFNSLFKACKVLGLGNNAKFEFCGFGTVNGVDGKPFKTRLGSAPKLDSLFEQVKETLIKEKESNKELSSSDLDILVNATIKFADLQNQRTKDYIFDIEKFSKFVGKTGPYILYTYTRINKMLNDLNIPATTLSNAVYNDIDRQLKIYLLKLENSFSKALELRLPSYICDYIYNLCDITNAFYENNRLANEKDENKKQDYVTLLSYTRTILKNLLQLILIDTPTKM